ncbi:MAG: hypothetical protein EBU90_28610 [Proteobacteria bacterium]|nr:hypothetical protein [Pseudomonadota bacterium]
MSNKITIHNVETGEIYERDLTEQEIAQIAIDQETTAKAIADYQVKQAAKAELLNRLGITEDEARLLLA